jgi:hypothetical protein
MCHNILNSIENNEKDQNILKYFKVMADEIQDPFAGAIDDFLKEKQEKEKSDGAGDSEQPTEQFENQEDNPQDDARDELKDEAVDYKEPIEQDHPQEEAVDELKDEALDYKEPVEQDHPQEEAVDELKDEALDYKEPVEQDHPQEEAVEKVVDEIKNPEEDTEEEKDPLSELESKQNDIQKQIEDLKNKKEEARDAHIESSLKTLGLEISKRGYPKIGTKFIMAASAGVLEVLNNLLRKEFLIKDIIDNYSYLYTSEIVNQLAKYKSKETILYLQKQIINYAGTPTTQRLIIPTVNPASINPPGIDGILVLMKEHDADLVSDYIAAINSFGKEDKLLTLKVMFTKIIQSKTKFMTELK